MRRGNDLIVFDASTLTSTKLPVTGKVIRGRGKVVTIADDLYHLPTAKRIGSSRSDAVVAHAANHRVLLGHAPGACTPRAGDLPYACVDGVPNLAAGGSRQLPVGPLRWAP